MKRNAPIKVLRLAGWRWLSALTQSWPSRLGGPAAFAHRDAAAHEVRDPGVNLEAAAIMRDALRRGASHLELSRAALAAVQEILRMIEESKSEISDVIEAANTWVLSPNHKNAQAVWLAEQSLNFRCGRNPTSPETATSGDWARMAVDAAAMACCTPFGASMLAVLAVECAANAAGDQIDLAPLVTAALL